MPADVPAPADAPMPTDEAAAPAPASAPEEEAPAAVCAPGVAAPATYGSNPHLEQLAAARAQKKAAAETIKEANGAAITKSHLGTLDGAVCKLNGNKGP
eukprot:4876954-Prymnesium_polylepis.1